VPYICGPPYLLVLVSRVPLAPKYIMSAPAAASAKADASRQGGGRLSLNLEAVAPPHMAPGERNLEGGDFLTTARASNEVAITVRGNSKMRARRILQLLPSSIGADQVKAAWRPKGSQLALACQKDGNLLLYLYTRATMPKPTEVHNLGPGRPLWLDWDCMGTSLAVMQENTGIHMWDVPQEGTGPAQSQPLRLAPQITKDATFCMWSKKFVQLAIGTSGGKVIIYNKPQGVMQLHDRKGKHGAAISCGDWLMDNRLGLASGTRVKVSKPLSEEGALWESHSKFKL
jgi:hypothetical protein